MTPQQLRSSILQLAIQGKLVEQRPEEGTGAELLRDISTRSRGVRGEEKGKSKVAKSSSRQAVGSRPSVVLPEDAPFEIPESWVWVRLENVLRVIGGVSYDKKDIANTGFRILRGGNIQNMKVILAEDDVFLPAQYADDDKLVRVGDILIVASTGSKAVIGKGRYVDSPLHNTMIGAFLRICRPCSFELADYLRLIFQGDFYRKHVRELAQGTNINNVKESYITQFAIPLPPLAEQKRIVAKIEELLPLVDRYEKAWSRLEEFNRRFPEDMRKSLLQMAIQGKLVEQRPEEGTGAELLREILAAKNAKDAKRKSRAKSAKSAKESRLASNVSRPVEDAPFEIPESWVWVRLGNIASVLGGKRIPAGRQLTHENTGHIYIRVSDMKNDSIDTSHLMYVPLDIYPSISRYIIKKEDVYITVAGTIGRVGKIPPELDGANLTENADRLMFECINQKWLIQCLKSSVVQTQISDCTTKVGQPKLAIKRIEDLLLPLPPLAEQKRIVAKLEEILPLCERLKKTLEDTP